MFGPYRARLSRIAKRGENWRGPRQRTSATFRAPFAPRATGSRRTISIETFALVREVSARALGLRPFDVQMLAGIAMHEGQLVEMQTGEGKTLAAVAAGLPQRADRPRRARADLQRLPGPTRRRTGWARSIGFLGLSVGSVQEGMRRTSAGGPTAAT